MKKTLSFASIHTVVAFSVGYIMTGDIAVGGALAIIEPACNTVAYYFHEKVWTRFNRKTITPYYMNPQAKTSAIEN
jgi:uncharacterized membrane protein